MTTPRQRITFYGSLEPRLKDQLNLIGRRRWYLAGDPIYAQGQLATTVMVVLDGRVSLETSLPGGEPFVGICYTGQLLGDSETLIDRPIIRRHTARALDHVGLLIISFADFSRFTAEEPWVWQAIARDTRARLDTAEFWIGQLAAASSEQRLARVLLFFADQNKLQEQGEAVIDLTYGQLASWVGVTCRTIERHMEEWEKLGFISRPFRRGRVRILRAAKLAERARSDKAPAEAAQPSPVRPQVQRSQRSA